MKDLYFSKEERSNLRFSCAQIEENGGIEFKAVQENPGFATQLIEGLYLTSKLLIDDCNTLEAEVERLREENETLKKQMEDDLK